MGDTAGCLAHQPRLASPRAGPVSEDPDLGRLPTQLGIASYSILPMQIAVKDQRNDTMAPEKRPRPVSAATVLSDLTDVTDRADQPIEADVRQFAPPARSTTQAQLTDPFV